MAVRARVWMVSSNSRFENSHAAEEAIFMGREMEDVPVSQLKRQRPKGKCRPRIVIDLEPSVDPIEGGSRLNAASIAKTSRTDR